ncbi:AAEL005509-PA, partial [Aedes aegypti]
YSIVIHFEFCFSFGFLSLLISFNLFVFLFLSSFETYLPFTLSPGRISQSSLFHFFLKFTLAINLQQLSAIPAGKNYFHFFCLGQYFCCCMCNLNLMQFTSFLFSCFNIDDWFVCAFCETMSICHIMGFAFCDFRLSAVCIDEPTGSERIFTTLIVTNRKCQVYYLK